jgi:hypothetical protein
MNALEKYAAKSKLIKKLMKKMKKAKKGLKKGVKKGGEKLYGKKPKRNPLGETLGMLGGSHIGAKAAKARNAKLRKIGPLSRGDAREDVFMRSLKGGAVGGSLGKKVDDIVFSARKAKHTARKKKVNLGLGAAAGVTGGGAAGLAAIIAKKKKSKKKG